MAVSLGSRIMAAVKAFRDFGHDRTFTDAVDFYDAAWALVDGSAFRIVNGKLSHVLKDKDVQLYRNCRLLFSHAGRMRDFYAAMIYAGTLATDGKQLPDGSLGAIPIDPQTGGQQSDAQLRAVTAAWWDRVRWQQGMGLRPAYGAILGECLTELIDDPARHAVWPQLVWPGYVVGLDLDIVGDVKSYALEYLVTRVESNQQVTFRYRKEVDKAAYRYYRDDGPFDYDGGGWEQENPYGFVPAIWDRHKIGRDGQSMSAIADTLPALYELNSFFSHGIDYARKTFWSPIAVKGGTGQPGAQQVVGPSRASDPRALAETQDIVNVSENGGVEILQFDMGEARQVVADLKSFILESNPEVSFYHELRQMSTLTGPAVERALGDAVSRITLGRGSYDPQTVKLQQMQASIGGYRYHDAGENGWQANGGLAKRDEVYAPYQLDSYKNGAMDMSIRERPVVPRTEEERLAMVEQRERLRYEDSFEALGMEKNDAKTLIAARESAELRRVDIV